ncbi:PilN domain-containing protein [uncultured Desulfuromusa sp.]|uniref:PilN domain-containing protein n=1 Tax=uncultured Desulfuromusa sp. TaxID=219183 RepID=UPI002AA68AD2|nr:PilN domain-containing protein [uncultured Desulfuromusa sp.]
MIRINLLPVRAAQKKEKLRSQISIFILCMILVCIACGSLYVQKILAINTIKDEIASIDQKNKALSKKIGQVRDFEKKQADLEKKLVILQKLKDGKSGPVHLLDELSAALPDKLWLTKFSEKGGKINLTGVADSENTVAVFMRNLDASPYYQNIELAVTEQTKAGERKMQKFTLNCSVEAPPSE